MQATLSNLTDAFEVAQTPSETIITLSDDISTPTCPVRQVQLSADWEQCSSSVANGTACAYFQIPCPVSLQGSIAKQEITCPDNLASQPPFSEPPFSFDTSAQIGIELTRDDGTTKPLTFPPPNGGELSLVVTRGASSCDIDYDGTSPPRVQARAGAGCTNTVCEVEASYSEPCLNGTGPINGTCGSLEVVIVVCLQAQLACHNVTVSPFQGTVPPSLTCTAESAALRQLNCSASEFQQRTLWAAALLSRLPAGARHAPPWR